MRYDSQDRTPVCSICKTKGHYKTDCGKDKGVAQKGETVKDKETNEREDETNDQKHGGEEEIEKKKNGRGNGEKTVQIAEVVEADKEKADRGIEYDARCGAEEKIDREKNERGDMLEKKRQLAEENVRQFGESDERDHRNYKQHAAEEGNNMEENDDGAEEGHDKHAVEEETDKEKNGRGYGEEEKHVSQAQAFSVSLGKMLKYLEEIKKERKMNVRWPQQ